MAFIIGERNGPDQGMVREPDGHIEAVELRYLRAHPEWYVYDGHLRINGILYHVFVYRA